jgi:hypothetical protein
LQLITQKALKQFVREQIKNLLDASAVGNTTSAVNPGTASTTGQLGSETVDSDSITESEPSKQVVTTEEELEGFYIVKSILREAIDPNRIFYRDVLAYCGILLDDNRNKTICRLYFNNSESKKLVLFDHVEEGKQEERVPIKDLNDIYKYADRLKATVSYYEKK